MMVFRDTRGLLGERDRETEGRQEQSLSCSLLFDSIDARIDDQRRTIRVRSTSETRRRFDNKDREVVH